LIPILAEFLRAYPDIDIRLLLVDRILSLPEDHVDVALRVGTLPDSRLIALRLGTIRRVVGGRPAYLDARGTPRARADRAAHACIIEEGASDRDVWTFVRDGVEVAITVRPRLVVSNLEAAYDAARAGIGLTRAFSYHVGAAVEAGTLTTVLDEFQLPTRSV